MRTFISPLVVRHARLQTQRVSWMTDLGPARLIGTCPASKWPLCAGDVDLCCKQALYQHHSTMFISKTGKWDALHLFEARESLKETLHSWRIPLWCLHSNMACMMLKHLFTAKSRHAYIDSPLQHEGTRYLIFIMFPPLCELHCYLLIIDIL